MRWRPSSVSAAKRSCAIIRYLNCQVFTYRLPDLTQPQPLPAHALLSCKAPISFDNRMVGGHAKGLQPCAGARRLLSACVRICRRSSGATAIPVPVRSPMCAQRPIVRRDRDGPAVRLAYPRLPRPRASSHAHKKARHPIGAAGFHVIGMVPEVRLELTRLATKVFETSASAIPPLGHKTEDSIPSS